MRAKNQNENLPTEDRLRLALAAVDEPVRSELFNAFHLMNPIEFARLLLSLELSNDVRRELLLTQVSQPPKYRGPALEMLVETAMQDFWSRLTEERAL